MSPNEALDVEASGDDNDVATTPDSTFSSFPMGTTADVAGAAAGAVATVAGAIAAATINDDRVATFSGSPDVDRRRTGMDRSTSVPTKCSSQDEDEECGAAVGVGVGVSGSGSGGENVLFYDGSNGDVRHHGVDAGSSSTGKRGNLRAFMKAKALSYRVRSDGTADVSAYPSRSAYGRNGGGMTGVGKKCDAHLGGMLGGSCDDGFGLGGNNGIVGNRVRTGSICPMGARDVGIMTCRRARRETRKSSSKRSLMGNRDDRAQESMPSIDETTNLLSAKTVDKMGGGAGSTRSGMGTVEFADFGSVATMSAMGDESERNVEGVFGDANDDVDEKDGGGDNQDYIESLRDIFFGKAVSILLVCVPLAFASHACGWSPVAVFWFNFFALVPLASILGDFTEDVAAHTNQVLGGLINATFGNAIEVVVGIQALLADEIRVVQASMIGSIFSNLLLVLGGCFFFGGLRYKEQSFNSTAATANMSLLALSSLALVLPTPFAEYYEVQDHDVLTISRIAACFLIFMYLQLLIFQLRTHSHLFEDEDEEEPNMPLWVSVGGLVAVTALIALLSEYLVESIDGFCDESGVSRTFVGLIILPIVGNAVEHITAINVAMKNKMDLAMGVAVGSCTQISLFVIPVTVIVGWACGKDMTLNFPQFEIILFILSIVIVSICISNPKSNWLEGSLLMTTYLMIAVGFWFERVINYNTVKATGKEL